MNKLLITILLMSAYTFAQAQVDSLTYGLKGKIIRALTKSPNDQSTFYAGLKGDDLGSGLIYKSADAGKSWHPLNNGKAISAYTSDIQAIAIDETGSIYSGTWKDGLYKSTDEGKTWQRIYAIPSGDIRSIKTGVQTRGLVYAATSAFGVVKSMDHGKTWIRNEPSVIDSTFKFAWSIEIDPKNDNIVYAQTYKNGLWKSTDQGASWKQLLKTEKKVCWDLKISKNSKELWAVASKSGENSVHYSADQGATWTALENVPSIGVSQINVVEQGNTKIIYIGGWDDGLYVLDNNEWKKVEAVDFETIAEILLNGDELLIGSWGNGIYHHNIN